MNDTIDSFLRRARAGDPVYITHVRRAFEALPPQERFELGLSLTLPDGAAWNDTLSVPRFEPGDHGAFVEEYVLAELYNRLSALGPQALVFHARTDVARARSLYERFRSAFGLEVSRQDRRGYGRAVNVLERLVDTLEGQSGSRMTCRFVEGAVAPRSRRAPQESAAEAAAQRALRGLKGRVLLGVDVGGSDIKLVLSLDGRLASPVEFDWFPARFTRVASLTDPIDDLVALMALKALDLTAPGEVPGLASTLAPAFAPGADEATLARALKAARAVAGGRTVALDGIGLSFPDVVVADRIVGGEVYKTRGIRDNPELDYEAEFRGLTDLSTRLQRHLAPGGVVATINDGPMAAFTALVEQSLSSPGSVRHGIFAHTLGTELGTGWVTEAGTIPDLPLEVYNFVIDLGSYPERAFACDDPRSTRNFNTDVPGTLQKYTSQSGAFRLALKTFPKTRSDLVDEFRSRGFLVEAAGGLRVPTEPKDQRKAFLEHLMALPDKDDDPVVHEVFRSIGEFLAVATLECDALLAPAVRERVLFGRLVKNATCFRLMREGARRIDPTVELVPADDDLAASALMRELKADPHHTVAQFAQAVGAVHYVASRLSER